MRLIISKKLLAWDPVPKQISTYLLPQALISPSVRRLEYPPKRSLLALKFCGSSSLAFAQLGKLGFDLRKLDPVYHQLPPTYSQGF